MARPGDHADRSPEPARVLEAVLERHHPISRAPEHECRADHPVELETRIVADESRRGRCHVRRVVPAFEESKDGLRGQVARQTRAPVAERERPEERPGRDVVPQPRRMTRGLQEPGEREERLRPAGGGRDAGRLHEGEGGDPGWVGHGQPESDNAAHRVADESSGSGCLLLQDRGDAVCVGAEVRMPADRARAAVTRKVGNENSPRARQERRQARPVRGCAP